MKLKNCEVMTQLKYINLDEVEKILNSREAIKDYAMIVHNKDVYTEEDEIKNPDHKAGTKKEDHIHLLIRLHDSYDTKYIANWFGLQEQYISKIRCKWVDALKYLTHENATQKYQYSEDEVISNYAWKEEKEKLKKSANYEARKEEIINLIVSGEIRQFNYFKHITAVEHDKFKKSIDNAFKYRLDTIKGGNRDMKAMYFYGDAGTGKTTYAKELCEKMGYSYCVSSGSNDPLDSYKGEDVIILDDLRPSVFSLSDLLKMLDNNTASTVKSRYYNKVLECKMIIITSTLQIDEFFKNVFSEQKETIKQLKRRCKYYYRFTEDKIYMRYYNEKSADYSAEYEQPNPSANLYPKEDLTEEELIKHFKEMSLSDCEIVKSEEQPTNAKPENILTLKEKSLTNENIKLRKHNELLMNELDKKII